MPPALRRNSPPQGLTTVNVSALPVAASGAVALSLVTLFQEASIQPAASRSVKTARPGNGGAVREFVALLPPQPINASTGNAASAQAIAVRLIAPAGPSGARV